VEYEDLLPYREFAVRIPSWLIWKLPDIVSRLIADTAKVRHSGEACWSCDSSAGSSLILDLCVLTVLSLLERERGRFEIIRLAAVLLVQSIYSASNTHRSTDHLAFVTAGSHPLQSPFHHVQLA
jgi:hypothetical protein